MPLKTGMTADKKANTAEAVAMGMAIRITHFTPHRFTPAKMATMHPAMSGTGNHGAYHWLMAEAESNAVNPQVGTQPHQ